MNNNQSPNKPKFDLEERTTNFARKVVKLCKSLPRNPINDRIVGQVVGCSGSIGANYREANDALGKKDFIMHMKISRKESKESIHWLILLADANAEKEIEIKELEREANEYKNIFSAIINKTV